MPQAEWRVDGPGLLSVEQTAGDGEGFLGTDYTEGCDTRWANTLVLAPKLNNLDLSGVGGTAANVNCGAIAPASMNATGPFLYLGRGTDPAKVKLADMSVIDPGISLGERATSAIYTKTASGTEEISFGMDNTAYHVIGTVGNTTDTASANDDSYKARIFGYAGASSATGQIAGLGRGTGSVMNVAALNVLSGVTMDNGNWNTRATFAGEPIIFTGFAMDGNFQLIGTTNGPYFLNSDFQEFQALIEELDQNDRHCRNMASWSVLGPAVLIPLARSLRISRNLQGSSVGPEVYRENTSPVTSPMASFCASELWGYGTFYNAVQDVTYLCAIRPRLPGDWHFYPLSYFPLVKLGSGIESDYSVYTGTLGGRTLPTVVMGKDSDAAYFGEGRLNRFIDDTSYQYGASGTWYGTELRRLPHVWKRLRWIEFEASNVSATQTITVKVQIDGETAVQVGGQVTATDARGMVRVVVPHLQELKGKRLRPVIEMATGSSTASPRIEGVIRLGYDMEDMVIDGVTV